jgi:hypothetical protein
LASVPASMRCEVIGRKVPADRSSSRLRISFTGRFTAFDTSAASTDASTVARRPKPPPRYSWLTFTFCGSMPSALPTSSVVRVGAWVPTHNSTPSPCTSAVAFIGSICAWYT